MTTRKQSVSAGSEFWLREVVLSPLTLCELVIGGPVLLTRLITVPELLLRQQMNGYITLKKLNTFELGPFVSVSLSVTVLSAENTYGPEIP